MNERNYIKNFLLPNLKKTDEQKSEYRLPMVSHLLSLPVDAFVAASQHCSTKPTLETAIEKEDQPSYRLPVVSELLSMPIDAFKSSSNTHSVNELALVQVEPRIQTSVFRF